MKTTRTYKVVIDADNQTILHKFEASETNNVMRYYKRLGRWEDVGVDYNGDIILWQDL